MAKSARAYRGAKRRKEVARQKKQEHKRQKRFQKGEEGYEPQAEEAPEKYLSEEERLARALEEIQAKVEAKQKEVAQEKKSKKGSSG